MDTLFGVFVEKTTPAEQTTDDVTSTNLCAVGPDAGFYEAAQAMSENGVRRLPARDENDELVGVITADDLTEVLADNNQQLGHSGAITRVLNLGH